MILSRPDIAVIADLVSLHQCFVTYHLDLRIKAFGPGVVAVADVRKTYISGFSIEESLGPDTFCHLQLEGCICVLDNFMSEGIFIHWGAKSADIGFEAVVG